MSSSPSVFTTLTLLSPPDAVPPSHPVETRVQVLPFDALSWENFERLCHRLTALDGNVEHCERYGRQGDAQEGIDVFARQTDGKYHCLQAKRHRRYGAANLRQAVDLFLAGSWAARSARFTIAIQAQLRSIEVQEEIECQAARLKVLGITFQALDGESLTDRLRSEPVLVDDFFGRNWVTALLGPDTAASLGARLDGAAFARVRAQLASVYEAQFQFLDPGSFGSINDEDGQPALTLFERFLKPDFLVRETARLPEHADTGGAEHEPDVEVSLLSDRSSDKRQGEAISNSRMRRISTAEWFGDGQRLVVLGDAGSGKSTLLRVVALDLLHAQSYFPELAARWGKHIPVYIPFARWSGEVARDGHPIGIKEIVRRSVEQFLSCSLVDLLDRAIDEKRVLLLIDGLDEWSNEQAARVALSALVITVEGHGVPVIVSGRPRGLNRIGALPTSWKRGTIAPLSATQQVAIAGRWFERYSATAPGRFGLSDANLRIGRFTADLARDVNLGALAKVPLLLIGLVILALRGQTLPRTRSDIYDQLVRVLLEDHPDRRATASGDTEPRFRYATDPTQRRAAISSLAFAVREQAGGAGMPTSVARDVLRTHFTSPDGFALSEIDAAAAANEILSINAETQGLIVEKAPDEIGFIHASFEEFLSAEYVGAWPLSDIEVFVRNRAGDGRWRNVIVNILCRIQRRNEFDQLVAIIEYPVPDEVGRFNREALLGDIAFSASMRAPITAKRLALAAMDRVETEDWMPARREALASVLKGLTDPTLKGDIEQRLGHWLPARLSFRAPLIGALGAWKPSAQLQDLLFRAMHDEDGNVQRAASAAYAKAYSSSVEAYRRLLDGIARTRDLAAATALLECVAYGWPSEPQATSLFEEAWNSHSSDLRLVGALGLANIGIITNELRDAALRGQSIWSDTSYPYRDLARTLLMKYWPDDDALIESALSRAAGNSHSVWECDSAMAYLLQAHVDRTDVRSWILREFDGDYPFNSMDRRRIWSNIGRFAAADSEIRAAANAYWCNPEKRLINIYNLPEYVGQVADPAVAVALIGMLDENKTRFDRYWALRALLTGWGRDHPVVKPAIDALADLADEDLSDLLSLLPEIMSDKSGARQRLIRIGANSNVRRDLLITGLEACNCDSNDDEAVAAIFAFPQLLRGPFDGAYPLLRSFGLHAEVRALALERIQEEDAPFMAIAAGYPEDPEFAPALLAAALPLPIDLRSQVLEVAAAGATGTALENVLGHAMLETDPELRARMVIAHYRNLPPDAYDAAKNELRLKAVSIGPDYQSVRAAALAGLVTIGAFDVLAELEDRGNPATLESGGMIEGINSVERLICERFAEFEAALGESLPQRFKSVGKGNRLAEILSAAPGASPEARATFLALAEHDEIPRTPHALRALAAERPGSNILLARCLDTLDKGDSYNNRAMINANVGLILREHFPGDPEVRQRLVERLQRRPYVATAVPLAIFAPESQELRKTIDLAVLGHEFADWTVAVHVAAYQANSASFCELLEAMVTRPRRSQFDAQQFTNIAIEERLQRDQELQDLMGGKICIEINPSISGSFARYLAAAGKLNPKARSKALELLDAFGSSQRLPIAGYDAIADQLRAARATLLDAVSAGLEMV
ncbi:NACHT domain-containing protein [Pseudomonas sp. PDM29]|uniref:NACHT domain-containing protein n=1 Tax=Pseudomonas sp. PDM29 TaxID=2854771 RepID=UPI001C456589|nr:NACHT domain-containing protein [Pseudomonas sp. PDM29]MBV7527257.1 NACHT domain-containing protein [Pseudomonas sp. PDM29]